MTFTNLAPTAISRKALRRQRAATRMQTVTKPYFTSWDSHAIQVLQNKLTEFLGLCRNGALSPANVYPAAVNVLAPVAEIMGRTNHQHWLTVFNTEGQAVFIRKSGY